MTNYFHATTALSHEPEELEAFAISTGVALMAMEWAEHKTTEEKAALINLAYDLQSEELEAYYEGKPASRIALIKAKIHLAGVEQEERYEAFVEEVTRLLEARNAA